MVRFGVRSAVSRVQHRDPNCGEVSCLDDWKQLEVQGSPYCLNMKLLRAP